ncbi:MAG: nitroreductase [Limisphaerales bacterium]|jgi:nitroreductase
MIEQQYKIVANTITNRRSLKPEMMASKQIDDQIIKELLELANWAPNHALTQPWRFNVYCGKGREVLGSQLSSLYKKHSSETEFKVLKFEKMQARPPKASHIISIGMKRMENEKLPEVEEIAAVACAVQNICLAAYSLGIGSYWGSGGMIYHPEFRTWLDLGEKDQVLGLLYLGYPLGDWPASSRTSIDSKVKWIKD